MRVLLQVYCEQWWAQFKEDKPSSFYWMIHIAGYLEYFLLVSPFVSFFIYHNLKIRTIVYIVLICGFCYHSKFSLKTWFIMTVGNLNKNPTSLMTQLLLTLLLLFKKIFFCIKPVSLVSTPSGAWGAMQCQGMNQRVHIQSMSSSPLSYLPGLHSAFINVIISISLHILLCTI